MNYLTNAYTSEPDVIIMINHDDTLKGMYLEEKELLDMLYRYRLMEPHGKRRLYSEQETWFSFQQDMLLKLRYIRDEICLKLEERTNGNVLPEMAEKSNKT